MMIKIGNIFLPDKIYTCHDVAEVLELSQATIRGKIKNRSIPYFKVGSGRNAPVRFSGKALNYWLDKANDTESADAPMLPNNEYLVEKYREKWLKKKKR